MRKIKNILGLATAALLAACSTAEPPPPASSETALIAARQLLQEIPAFAGQRPALVSSDEIYQLSAAQRDAFLDYYRDPANRKVPGHKRIGQYLVSSKSAFNYVPETRTADEVYQLEGGNCLSLANITTALARLAGVKVGYQLRDDIPVYELQENIILRGVHVRSILYEPLPDLNAGDGGAKLIIPLGGRASVIIDYFPTGRSRYIRRISEPEFTAMYYRNLAGEAIVAGDLSRAYWFAKESMLHAPDHAEAVNMLAILYRRSGDEWAAEQIYLYGLNSARERLSLLKNYRTLLREQGRAAEADEMTRRIAKYNDADPFEWWFLAEDAYGEEKYSDALSYYKKTVEIAPYLHEGYFGMAKTYFQLGRVKSAMRSMRQAIENADRPRFRALYEAKLRALSAEHAN